VNSNGEENPQPPKLTGELERERIQRATFVIEELEDQGQNGGASASPVKPNFIIGGRSAA
jgi:hypothetical protein